MSPPAAPSRVDRLASLLFRPFGEVRPGEAGPTVVLTFTVFLILTAYYLLKVVREPLILQGGGAEVKTYAAVGQAALLIGVTRGYAWLTKRLGRMPLSVAVFLFFAAAVLGFLGLNVAGVAIGIPFYLFVGVFSLTVIAQFWSFANDIHTPEQGKRLFAIVGIGSSVGAVVGAKLAGKLFHVLGVNGLLVLTAGLLVVSLGGLFLSERAFEHPDAPRSEHRSPPSARHPKTGLAGVLGTTFDRYLWLLVGMVLLLNAVNTTGEYILDRTLLEKAAGMGDKEHVKAFIAEFKGSYFSWVNIIGVGLQLFVASRLLKHLGVRVALLILPIVSLGGSLTMLLMPVLSAIFVAKVAENSVDYSIRNTTHQALFLVTSRESKYAAKNFIDTFVVRFGDVLAAGLIFVGSHLAFPTQGFILANVVMIVSLLVVVVLLGRENTRLAESAPRSSSTPRSSGTPGATPPSSTARRSLGATPA